MSTASRNSIYSDYLFSQLIDISNRGGGVWSLKDIAVKLGLTPNHNLRARLKQAEKEGLLYISYGIVGKHSTCYLYNVYDNRQNQTFSPNSHK